MRYKYLNPLLISILMLLCVNTIFVYANEDTYEKAVQPVEALINPLVFDDFVFNGLHANQDLSKTPLRSLLGEPLRIEDKSWKNNDLDRTYFYPGFRVTTVIYNQYKYEGIIMIILNGPGPKTARGISVGDSIDSVFSKYGKETSYDKDNERFSYLQHFYFRNIETMYFYHLEFKCEANKVKEIVYFMSI